MQHATTPKYSGHRGKTSDRRGEDRRRKEAGARGQNAEEYVNMPVQERGRDGVRDSHKADAVSQVILGYQGKMRVQTHVHVCMHLYSSRSTNVGTR